MTLILFGYLLIDLTRLGISFTQGGQEGYQKLIIIAYPLKSFELNVLSSNVIPEISIICSFAKVLQDKSNNEENKIDIFCIFIGIAFIKIQFPDDL